MSNLALSHLKYSATAAEVFELFELANRVEVDVTATVEERGRWIRRRVQFVELNATSRRGQLFIGAVYEQLREIGRA